MQTLKLRAPENDLRDRFALLTCYVQAVPEFIEQRAARVTLCSASFLADGFGRGSLD
jgi:hypothetical protein